MKFENIAGTGDLSAFLPVVIMSSTLFQTAQVFQTIVYIEEWVQHYFNSSPNCKTSDLSKLKAFADDKLNVTQNLKFVWGRLENIAGKGENAGYQHFLLFLQCFQKFSFSGSLKVGIVW